jgi:ketosteroid isomerase-like protein
MATDAAINDLLDREAIRDVIRRYAHAVDRRDLDAVAACFMPDAAYRGSLGEGTIDIALAALRQRVTRYARTMHFIGNQLIDLHGDTASSETYAIAYHQIDSDGERRNVAVGVRYLDEFVRHQGTWRIQRRAVELEWQRQDPLTLPNGR